MGVVRFLLYVLYLLRFCVWWCVWVFVAECWFCMFISDGICVLAGGCEICFGWRRIWDDRFACVFMEIDICELVLRSDLFSFVTLNRHLTMRLTFENCVPANLCVLLIELLCFAIKFVDPYGSRSSTFTFQMLPAWCFRPDVTSRGCVRTSNYNAK